MNTVVTNMRTGEELHYSLPPREAVIAAYAYGRRDGSTWTYQERYGRLVEMGQHFFFAGDWAARIAS